MILVINEWIFHDLSGENGPDRQRESVRFLVTFRASEDKIVIPNEVRWMMKAHGLLRHTAPGRKEISKLLHSLLRNSDKAVRVQPEAEAVISDELLGRLPEEDVYLVSAYMSARADALVTTDLELHESLADSPQVICRTRTDFLGEYLG